MQQKKFRNFNNLFLYDSFFQFFIINITILRDMIASTDNNASQTAHYKVKVPKNSKEERVLKESFVEDDNEDLAYFNFRII